MMTTEINNGARLGGTPRPTTGTLSNRPSTGQPAWTPRALVGAAGLTLLLFGLLPLAHVLNAPALDDLIALHPAEIAAWTPPPTLPLAEPEPQLERTPEPIRIDLPAPVAATAPQTPAIATDWAFALPAVPGDLGMAFGVGEWAIEGAVFTLAEIDAPPRPLMQAPPMYPQSARHAGLEGHVQLEFVVTTEGRVTDVRVMEARPGTVFVAAAVSAVERWRFEPAQRRGEPVAVRVDVPLEFRLDR